MGLFDAVVRTVINVATLPVDIVKDIVTLGDVLGDDEGSFTTRKLEKIKDEAQTE